MSPPAESRPHPTWVALVDTRCGRLLRRGATAAGRPRLDELDRLDEAWVEREHGRPSMLAGKGRSFASHAHEDEERRRRFAREIARWLQAALDRPDVDVLDVHCARPMLGELRKALRVRHAGRLRLAAGDLSDLTPAQLLARWTPTG
jgi:hypothetical protein